MTTHRRCKRFDLLYILRFVHLPVTFIFHRVQSSSEKAAQDLFQMYEAVREDEHQKQPK